MQPQTVQQPSSSAPTFTSDFTIELDFFTGPMDLLLHLVRREEVSIEDVEMSKIADQYLQIVDAKKELDLDIASEFLVVAATLVAIKSESVLPSQTSTDELGELENDPYGELRERLRRYEQMKRRARQLRQRPVLGLDTFSRHDREVRAPEEGKLDISDDAESLGYAFVKLLKRIGKKAKTFRIQLEPVSTIDCMMRMIDRLKEYSFGRADSFFGLAGNFFKRNENIKTEEELSFYKRSHIAANLIAILELSKRGVLSTVQRNEDDDIRVELKLSDAVPADFALPDEITSEKGSVDEPYLMEVNSD